MKRFLIFIASIMLFGSLFSFAFIGIASAHGVAASHSVQTNKQSLSKPNIYLTSCSNSGVLRIWISNSYYEWCFAQPGVDVLTLYNVNHVYAGNWSGYLTFSNGSVTKFCDYGNYSPSGTTLTQIYISPTRLSGC